MLINCPECGRTISDKALHCLDCGYPINEQPQLKPIAQKRKKFHKLPNNFGMIRTLTGNRRKPYAVYTAPQGYEDNGNAIRACLGYFETYQQAYDCLANYNKNPYDVDKLRITFKEVFDMWKENKYEKDQTKKMSTSSKNIPISAWKYLKCFADRPIRSIKTQELQNTIDSIPLKRSSIENIVFCLKNVFKFALQNDWVDKDYAQFVKINIPNDDEKGVPFTEEEIQKIWDISETNRNARITLFLIYTGFRISEIETLTFYKEERYCQGGLKSKAGKDRIVPINDVIYPFIDDISYDCCVKEWRETRFYPLLKQLGIATSSQGTKHTPHDCRHTFSWLCDKYGVDEFSKHLVMGHTLGTDVERNTYGHRTVQELVSEINKIKKPKG